jgi:hypothetical protein
LTAASSVADSLYTGIRMDSFTPASILQTN